jgi:ABC-2 type transport system permease protein
VIGTFAYLLGRSVRNRLTRQARRLRQPRYVVALALGAAYLWLVFFQQRPTAPAAAAAHQGWVEVAGAIGLALAVAWSWVFAVERRVLAFSPAEVTFLFSAPVTRRQLIHFKLLRSQLVILFNTLLWTLLLSRERFGASGWLRAVSLWVLLTTLALHRLGASFVLTTLAEHGGAGARRRVISLTLVAVALSASSWTALEARPALTAAWDEGLGPFLSSLAAAASGPIPTALLSPFRLMMAPLAAATAGAWVHAMGPALAIMAAHYVWVVRSDAAFEEAAVEESLRRARRTASRGTRPPVSTRRSAPLYRLGPLGSPAGAILWKNLTAVARTGRPRGTALVLLAAGAVLGALSFRAGGHLAEIVGWFATLWTGFLVVVGPQWVRSDLRGDLPKLDLLRTYPLHGRSIVAAEVAASTVVLSALQLGVATVAYLAFLGNRAMEPDLAQRTAILIGAILLLPAVNLLGLLIQNGAAVLFPAWVQLGAGRPGGVEALGQNMLAILAHVLVLGAALLVPAAIGAAIVLGLRQWLNAWVLVPAALAAIVVIAAEAVVVVRWLGRVFERTDPAAALSV